MNDEAIPNDIDFDPPATRSLPPVMVGSQEARDTLVAALATASGQFHSVALTDDGQAKGGRFKFAKLYNLVHATRPALSANGIVVLQFVTGPRVDGETRWDACHTWICGHGARIQACCEFARADNIQDWGSHRTYMRRYGYNDALMLDSSKDVGDEGDQDLDEVGDTAPRSRENPPKPPVPAKTAPKAPKPVPEPPRPTVAHDQDGVVGEDSPEAQAADRPSAPAPSGEDRSYLEDDQVRNAFKSALQASGLTTQAVKRHCHETFGVDPNRFSTLTISQCKQTIGWIKGQGK